MEVEEVGIKIIAGGGDDSTRENGETATDLDLGNPKDLAVDGAGDVLYEIRRLIS